VTVVLVHGVPETSAVWDLLVPHLSRGPLVRLAPPGFGAPVPLGFGATVHETRSTGPSAATMASSSRTSQSRYRGTTGAACKR
jgi:pimeloyl-ACP methyl ester carboxylesterase